MNFIRSSRLPLMFPVVFVGLSVIFLLVTAHTVTAAPGDTPPDMRVASAAAGEGWLTYTNDAGFSIQYPPEWVEEAAESSEGAGYQTVVVTGTEGAVWMSWGVGFGGACPEGYTTIQLAQGETTTCYSQAPDGLESWEQIYHELDADSFGARAQTFVPGQESHDLVLHVLSTLTFANAEATSESEITPEMLTTPGALMGPVPSSFAWSPVAPQLLYVRSDNAQDVLWLFDAATEADRPLLDPSTQPDEIDVTTAQWAPHGDVVLLTGATSLWLLDPNTGKLRSLATSDIPKTAVDFSPDGSQISYAQDNNLFIISIGDEQIRQLTTDGSATVYNGGLDWVYNEELATRAAQPAYAWSPDGKWFFYMRLDDGDVQSDPTVDYEPVPATVSWTRYPATGSPNPKISLHVLSLDDELPAQDIPLGADAEYVLPLFTWTPDGQEVVYMTVNRPQTVLEVKAWNPTTGIERIILHEANPHWINEDRYAAPVFLGDGAQFLWLSERDGYMQLYLYDRDGTLVRQVTEGDWMIDSLPTNILTAGHPLALDAAEQAAYVVTTRNSPLERQIDRIDLASGDVKQISTTPGFHAFVLSKDGDYLVDQYSDIDTPPTTMVSNGSGNEVALLASSAVGSLTLPPVIRETVELTASDGATLYAQLVKPADFDPSKSYPVVVHWYGGTGYQVVSNRYAPTYIFNELERDTLYTQAGFLVWRLDNRGSAGRGHVFETPIDGALGPVELEDQLVGIDYLRTLPYVDSARIGTDGKSFGGFLTLYGLIHAADALRCGVAIAGPTDWTYYDTIYTERYMDTPAHNPEGYASTGLIDKVGELNAAPLLIHGLDDTNVHLQNTINFIQALQENDKPYLFLPLPNVNHSISGDHLATVLSASTKYFEECFVGQ